MTFQFSNPASEETQRHKIPPKDIGQPMKIKYDRQVDIIQITLKEGAIAESVEETPGSPSAIAL